MVYMRAVELAGGLPVVLPPLAPDRVAPLVEQLAGICLSGGPDLAPAGYGARARPEPRPDGARAGPLRAVRRPAGRPARAPDPRHLPRPPGAQRRPRRHAAPAPARRHRRSDRPPADRAGPRHDPRGADRARFAVGGHPRRGGVGRELLPPPGGRGARPRPARGRVGARRHDRGHRERRRAVRARRAVARRGPRRPARAPRAVRDARARGRPLRTCSRPPSRRCAVSPASSGATAPPDREALARMQAELAPRGPDGEGMWCDGPVGLAHRRLAIIDLSPRGAQPMVDEALGLAVVFNGCIYNHRELRAELERAGHVFASTSDTEVLLKGWAAWGEGMLDRLAGMFAFALWERATGRLVLARDRLGVKPLYLADVDGRAALRLDAAGARRRRRRRHVGRPGGAAPLPVAARDRAAAADDPARRAQAPARDRAGRRARRHAARAALVGPAVHARPGAVGLVGARVGGGAAGGADHGGRAAHGGRRPGRRAALGRAGLLADRGAAGPRRAARARDVLDRLPRRRRPRGRRVRVLRPRGARARHGAPPDPHRPAPAASTRCPTRSAR